jgi:hypothetical protein
LVLQEDESEQINLEAANAFPAHARLTVSSVDFETTFYSRALQGVLFLIGKLRNHGAIDLRKQIFKVQTRHRGEITFDIWDSRKLLVSMNSILPSDHRPLNGRWANSEVAAQLVLVSVNRQKRDASEPNRHRRYSSFSKEGKGTAQPAFSRAVSRYY